MPLDEEESLSPPTLVYVDVKIKVSKELYDLAEKLAQFLGIRLDELLSDSIRKGTEWILRERETEIKNFLDKLDRIR